MPFDLMITVAFIGLFHLGIGILIGRNLKTKDEPLPRTVRWGSNEATVGNDLAFQLDSIVRRRLASAPNGDLAQRLRSLFAEIATIVEQSRSATAVANQPKAEEPAPPDAAGISGAKWFPVTPLEDSHKGTELRQARRFAYLRKQAIAPVAGDELPNAPAFVEVLFRDLSTNGFSFYAAEEFPVQRLVAKLGTPPDIVTVLARVVRQSEVWHDGQWVFHVACQIERRLVNEPALVSGMAFAGTQAKRTAQRDT